MSVDETLFRFVAVRDPQRRTAIEGPPLVLHAPAFNATNPTSFDKDLRKAPDGREVQAIAQGLVNDESKFVASMAEAPAVIQVIENLLIAGGERVAAPVLIKAAVEELRTDDNDSRGLRKLLAIPDVVTQRNDCLDSFLAVALARTPPPRAQIELARIVLLWSLLDWLADNNKAASDEVAAVLVDGVVLFPPELAHAAARPAAPVEEEEPAEGEEGDTDERELDRELRDELARSDRYESAAEDLLDALRLPEPVVVTAIAAAEALELQVDDRTASEAGERGEVVAAQPAAVDPWVLEGDLRKGLATETVGLLEEERLDRPGATVPTLVSELQARAAEAYERYATGVVYPRDGGGVGDPSLGLGSVLEGSATELGLALTRANGYQLAPLSYGQLTRPPVIGELEVVRQTLLRYERGEIAHVENVLKGELKRREHEIVDFREEEVIDVREVEEERLFDSQTTERNEMEVESSSVIQENASFEAGVNVSASYGPFVEVKANAGFAASTSKTESDRNAARFSREVTERAASRVRTRTEETRRRLTRRQVKETNIHELKGGNADTVGIYRWLNKVYEAQVYTYGLRVLLDIGIPDPSANYRYASVLNADLDVGVEPPPALTVNGKADGAKLTPAQIKRKNWTVLAQIFRVVGMPPPPAPLITVALPLSTEAPATGAADEEGAQAGSDEDATARIFKTSRELTIPNGFVPLRFVACVIADGPDFNVPELSASERQLIQAAANTLGPAVPGLQSAVGKWLGWDPASGQLPPALTAQERSALAVLAPLLIFTPAGAAASTSLQAFLNAAEPGRARPGVDLAVGPVLLHSDPGPRKVTGVFNQAATGSTAPAQEITAGATQGAVLPMAASAVGGKGFAATVTVLAAASREAFESWQQQAFEAVVEAYTAWRSDYEAALASAEAAEGVVIRGRNPLENAEIIRAELKRSAIEILGGVSRIDLLAVTPGRPDLSPPVEPKLDRLKAPVAARVVQFYEQAFEWSQMSYLFYPYFWSGQPDWAEASLRRDADPLFTQFLRAGSARIVLPIRPGFENVVASRLGITLPQPWPSPPAPVPAGDPYLDIADEIRLAQAITEGGVAIEPSWQLTLPTTLVVLEGPELPEFEEDEEDDSPP